MAFMDKAPSSASGLPPQSAGRENSRLAPPTRHSTRQLSQLSRDGTGSLSNSFPQTTPTSSSISREKSQLPSIVTEEGVESESPTNCHRDHAAERSVSSVSSKGSMIGFPDEQEFERRLEVLREDMEKSLQRSQQWRGNFQHRSESLVQRVRSLAQRRQKPAHAQSSEDREEVQGGLPTPDGNESLPSERVVEGGDLTPEAST